MVKIKKCDQFDKCWYKCRLLNFSHKSSSDANLVWAVKCTLEETLPGRIIPWHNDTQTDFEFDLNTELVQAVCDPIDFLQKHIQPGLYFPVLSRDVRSQKQNSIHHGANLNMTTDNPEQSGT